MPGKENVKADSLSQNLISQPEVEEDMEVQVALSITNYRLT